MFFYINHSNEVYLVRCFPSQFFYSYQKSIGKWVNYSSVMTPLFIPKVSTKHAYLLNSEYTLLCKEKAFVQI